MNSSMPQSATDAGPHVLSQDGRGKGDAPERDGWRKMQKAGASQTRKDGVGACDALYELAVKSGACDTEAAGFAHHVNGALALLEGQVHDGLHRESGMDAALAALTPPEGWVEQHARDSKELRKLCESRDFYKRRCDALQAIQSNMRDPERKAICDILANGSTAEYAAHQPRAQEAVGEIDEGEDGLYVDLYPDRDLPIGAKVYAAQPPRADDLPRWSQRHAEELHEAIQFALSVHAETLSKKKRDAISTAVKRMMIDSQRDAAPEASK